MSSGSILAIVIVIIILVILYRRSLSAKEPVGSYYGYFVNQEHLGAIFPQTGSPVLLIAMNDHFVVAEIDKKTNTFVPKVFPEFDDRMIVTSDPKKHPKLVLYACKTVEQNIDANSAFMLQAILDQDTSMPTIKIAPILSVESGTWAFIPTVVSTVDTLRKQLGFAPERTFINMPAQLPQWIINSEQISGAYKSGAFSGSLTNVKYPGLSYLGKPVTFKRWGHTGLAIIPDTDTDPQLLLVPTLTENQFRIYNIRGAITNKSTGNLENYSQLIAKNGALYEMTKKYADNDSARWTITLTK